MTNDNINFEFINTYRSLGDQGGVLRSSISWLARCVELKAWVSCPTKVALFLRRYITMVTYAGNQTWSGGGFQLRLSD